MSKEWEYAKMTKEAAEAGGPEKWIEAIKKSSYEEGASDKEKSLGPLAVAIGATIGVLVTIGVQKIYKWTLDRKETRMAAKLEAAQAEEYLKEKLINSTEEIEVDEGGEEV